MDYIRQRSQAESSQEKTENPERFVANHRRLRSVHCPPARLTSSLGPCCTATRSCADTRSGAMMSSWHQGRTGTEKQHRHEFSGSTGGGPLSSE